MQNKRFFFCDLETTGLLPLLHEIIEIGFIVTDHELKEISSFSRVIKPKKDPLWQEVSYKMHERSGLLDDIPIKGVSLDHAIQDAKHFLRQNGLSEETDPETKLTRGTDPLCGSSVHFDREFLKINASTLLQLFSHRNIDVSTIRELVFRWHPKGPLFFEEDISPTHRVLDDLRATIATLRACRPFFIQSL